MPNRLDEIPLDPSEQDEAFFEVEIPSQEKSDFSEEIIKKFPHIKRVVGILNDSDKEFVEAELAKAGENGRETENKDFEKTEREIEMISLAKKGADEILFQYGGTGLYDISLDRIHVVKKISGKDKEALGVWDNIKNSIELRRQENSVKFVMNAFHELVHSKMYNALQLVRAGDKKILARYRCGLSVYSRDKVEKFMENLDEAAQYELEKIFFDKYVRDNIFFQEKEKLAETIVVPGEGKERKYVGDDSNRYFEESAVRYIEGLLKLNQDRPEFAEYKKEEDIKNLMIRSAVDGDILKFGRMIKSAVGFIKGD